MYTVHITMCVINVILNVILYEILCLDDPAATILRVKNIKISSYIFEVKARTKLGECGTTSFTSTLNLLGMFPLFPFTPLYLPVQKSIFTS